MAYNYSMDTWVTFKLVGLLLLNIFYIVLTFVYLGAKGLLGEENLKDPNAAPTANPTVDKAEIPEGKG